MTIEAIVRPEPRERWLEIVLRVFLIIAAGNPRAHRSLVSFTAWSSCVHALVIAAVFRVLAPARED